VDEEQADEIKRKLPIQKRAKQTFETLLEATAQILKHEGSEQLTTNYLAERSGFSIGTIYQYFPNREAIVLALIERQRAKVARRVDEVLARHQDESLEQKIRLIIRELHQAFALHRRPSARLTKALLQMAVQHGIPSPPHVVANAIVELWQAAKNQGQPPLNDSEVFVLNQSIVEVLRQAALQGSPLLGTEQFEAAMVRLIMGFLRQTPDG